MIQALRLVRGFNVQQCVLMWFFQHALPVAVDQCCTAALPPGDQTVWIIQASVCLVIYERDGVTAAELRHKSGVRVSTERTCSAPRYMTPYIIFKP